MNTERAIIIGGGIAGLLAAKVLSAFYNEVVIVDRDDFPQRPELRPGTPQAFQPHRFTPRSRMILNRYFPGLIDELITQGAHPTHGVTTHLINPYGRMVAVEQGHEASFSRALFEWVVRRYVNDIPNVRLLGLNEAIQLQTAEDRSRVTGIIVRERASGERRQSAMTADLVVDTGGRFSKTVQWLSELGYEAPELERLKISLGYSTRRYRIPPGRKEAVKPMRMEGNPLTTAPAAALSIIENDIAEMVLWNLNGRYPSTDPERFEQEIRQIGNPLFNEALDGLEPIGPPRGFRVPELIRQRFDKMQRWPSGLLVMGDAICQLDPAYGQGMTLAAIEAEIVEACLQRQLSDPKPDFELEALRRMQDSIEPAWWLNVVSDLRWKGVEYVGSQPIQGLAFAQHYFDRVLEWTTEQANYDIFGLYWLVNSLFLHPQQLIRAEFIAFLLSGEGSGAAKEWLERWIEESDRPLEERLSATIPSFQGASFATIDELMAGA